MNYSLKMSQVPLGYLLREAFLIITLPYVLLLGSTSNGLVDYVLTRFSIGALFIVLIVWLVTRFPFCKPINHGALVALPLGRPIGLYLVIYALASFTSIDPRRSFGEVWLVGAYALAFLLVWDTVASGWPRELWVKALLITGAFLLAISLYTAIAWYGRWRAVMPDAWLPTLPYRLPASNTVAIFVNLLLMPALARLWVTRQRLPGLLLSLWILSALAVLFLTSSRTGWLSAVSGLMVTFWLSQRFLESKFSLMGLWRYLGQRRWLGGAMFIVGGVALGLIGWAAYRQLMQPTHGGRLEFWVPVWNVFLQSPWVGQGPFTYGSAYMRFSSVPPNTAFSHAHSNFFNLVAETGLLGLMVGIWLLTATLRALWQQLTTPALENRAVVVGTLGALFTTLVQGLFETTGAEPTNNFLLVILVAIALAPVVMRPVPRYHLHRFGIGAVFALSVGGLGLYGQWLTTPLHQGVAIANTGEWVEAEAWLSQAAQRDSRSVIVWQQLGLARSMLATQTQFNELPDAIRAMEMTVRLDPDWALNRANLGVLYAASGDTLAALHELREASRQAPSAALYHFNLGVVAENAHDYIEARQAYTRTLELRPNWAGAYFWRATPLRTDVLAEWRAAGHPPSAPTQTQLEAEVDAHSPVATPYARLALIYLSAGRLAEAEHLVKLAHLAYIFSGETRLEVTWAEAEVAAAQGDHERAAALGETVWNGLRAQSAHGPGTFGDVSYGAFLFRRETMWMNLVPQLTLPPLTDEWAARLVRLGDWYGVLGETTKAEEIYSEVLTAVPDSAEARARLP